ENPECRRLCRGVRSAELYELRRTSGRCRRHFFAAAADFSGNGENEKMRKPKGRNENQREKYSGRGLILSVLSALLLTACGGAQPESSETTVSSAQEETTQAENYDSVQDVPEYSGEPYVEINDNQPEFEEQELVTVSYEEYSELDELGRCG